MHKTIVLLMSLLLASAIPAVAHASEDTAPVSASVDQDVLNFLNLLRSGNGSDAVTGLLSSPLWASKAGARESMIGQIDAATRAYGPVQSYEKLSTNRLGTLVVREYYLVQHRDMVVRWEFDLVKSSSGWHVGYFGFTDQPNAWF